MLRAVCQLPLLERSRSLEPRVGRDHPCCWFKIWLFRLDGDRAYKNFVFQEDADHQEHEVEAEHDETQHFVHPPFAEGDGEDDEEQHDEEEDDGAEEAIAADGHWLESVNDGVQEPGQREPYSDVKNVASNRAGHGHVPEPLPGHYDTGDKIRDGGPSSQDGQTHDLFTDANCLTNLVCPPDHQVREYCNPGDGAEECDGKKLP